MKIGATILKVTPGATTRIEARTPEGRLVIVEVPGPQAAGLEPNDKLILDWDVFRFSSNLTTTRDKAIRGLFRRRVPE